MTWRWDRPSMHKFAYTSKKRCKLPTWQVFPVKPVGQLQVKSFNWSTHTPPLTHISGEQSSIFVWWKDSERNRELERERGGRKQISAKRSWQRCDQNRKNTLVHKQQRQDQHAHTFVHYPHRLLAQSLHIVQFLFLSDELSSHRDNKIRVKSPHYLLQRVCFQHRHRKKVQPILDIAVWSVSWQLWWWTGWCWCSVLVHVLCRGRSLGKPAIIHMTWWHTSQTLPVRPGTHAQTKSLTRSVHSPPARHGSFIHSLTFVWNKKGVNTITAC